MLTDTQGDAMLAKLALPWAITCCPFRAEFDVTRRLAPACFMSQRSPVIFWLLFAATIGVYAVVASWLAKEPFPTPSTPGRPSMH